MRHTSRRFAAATAGFCLALAGAAGLGSARAEVIRFNTDPFAGSTALTTPGRQVVGNELFINDFDVSADLFSFDPAVFDVTAPVSFFSGEAADLPNGGLNVVVLLNSDNDDNPATPFNAGSAANLIAAEIDTTGAGFFIYFNSVLNLNRLVYSTDLSDPTADLKILARIEDPVGQEAIDELATFTAANFDIVPAPASLGLFGVGAALFGLIRSRRPVG